MLVLTIILITWISLLRINVVFATAHRRPFSFLSFSLIGSSLQSNETMSYEEAIKKCSDARIKNPLLDQEPNGPSFCLGMLLKGLQRYNEAVDAFELALQAWPENLKALYNLAQVYQTLLRYQEAKAAFMRVYSDSIDMDSKKMSALKLVPLLLRESDQEAEKALTICSAFPCDAAILELKGATYHKLSKFGSALQVYESLIPLCNYSVRALLNAASAADVAEQYDKAKTYYLRAIEIGNYSDSNAWTKYGCFLRYRGLVHEAVNAFETAIRLDPQQQDSETGYAIIQLASLKGGLATDRMSASYVIDLFNGYASRFDENLCKDLSYVGHEFVSRALERALLQRTENLTADMCRNNNSLNVVLDIGCGTGLSGELLKPLSGKLVGVDIAEQMLREAANKNIYDELALSDAVTYLRNVGRETVDAIVAADVLIYIGALQELFAVVAAALKLGAFFVFTIEELPSNSPSISSPGWDGKAAVSPGVYLLPCGRFGHSDAYIRSVAADHGMHVVSSDQGILRTQSGTPVKSLTYTLKKL